MSHSCIRIVFCSLLAVVLSARSAGQVISAKAILDTNVALIGDQLKLRLTVEIPEEVEVVFPETGDRLTDKIEIVGRSDIHRAARSEGFDELEQDLLIAVFDTGYFEIPPLAFVFQTEALTDTIETLPAGLHILSMPLDSDIRDIKANISAPLAFREIYPYVLAVLLVTVAIWFVRNYYRRKYKNISVALANAKLDPPDVFALNELEKLRKEEPWLHNKIKHYYVRLSEIIRNYIERQFQVMALEQTTGEILSSMKSTSCDASNIEMLTQLLTLADLVKFAKVIPDGEENAEQIDIAVAFIKSSSGSISLPDQGTGELKSEGIRETVR